MWEVRSERALRDAVGRAKGWGEKKDGEGGGLGILKCCQGMRSSRYGV